METVLKTILENEVKYIDSEINSKKILIENMENEKDMDLYISDLKIKDLKEEINELLHIKLLIEKKLQGKLTGKDLKEYKKYFKELENNIKKSKKMIF